MPSTLPRFQPYLTEQDRRRLEAVRKQLAEERGDEPSHSDVLRVLLAAWERRGTREGGKDR